MRHTAVYLLSILLLTGCGEATQKKVTEKKKAKPKPPSLTQTMIDGATGRTAVRQGRQARDKIQDISQKRDDELSEVLGK